MLDHSAQQTVYLTLASCFFFSYTNPSGESVSEIRALRVFRVLRPFKGVHKIKKLQVSPQFLIYL